MSICDPKDKDREEEEKEGKGSRKDSMMVPAINFARRMSMKITGGAGPFTTNTCQFLTLQIFLLLKEII